MYKIAEIRVELVKDGGLVNCIRFVPLFKDNIDRKNTYEYPIGYNPIDESIFYFTMPSAKDRILKHVYDINKQKSEKCGVVKIHDLHWKI